MAAQLRCSFCNRGQQETRALVDGPGVRICAECITLCAELIAEEDREELADSMQRPAAGARIKEADPATIEELLRVLEADPDDVRTRLKLGDLYKKKNDLEAIKHYERVAARYASDGTPMKAIAVYKQMLKISETAEGVHGKLGELYERLGLLADAQLHYETQASIYDRAGDSGAAAAIRQRINVVVGGREGEASAARISPVLACSFCRKQQLAVKKLIAGPTVYICNECVEVCVDVMAKG